MRGLSDLTWRVHATVMASGCPPSVLYSPPSPNILRGPGSRSRPRTQSQHAVAHQRSRGFVVHAPARRHCTCALWRSRMMIRRVMPGSACTRVAAPRTRAQRAYAGTQARRHADTQARRHASAETPSPPAAQDAARSKNGAGVQGGSDLRARGQRTGTARTHTGARRTCTQTHVSPTPRPFQSSSSREGPRPARRRPGSGVRRQESGSKFESTGRSSWRISSWDLSVRGHANLGGSGRGVCVRVPRGVGCALRVACVTLRSLPLQQAGARMPKVREAELDDDTHNPHMPLTVLSPGLHAVISMQIS